MKDGKSTHGESVLLWLQADILASMRIYKIETKNFM